MMKEGRKEGKKKGVQFRAGMLVEVARKKKKERIRNEKVLYTCIASDGEASVVRSFEVDASKGVAICIL